MRTIFTNGPTNQARAARYLSLAAITVLLIFACLRSAKAQAPTPTPDMSPAIPHHSFSDNIAALQNDAYYLIQQLVTVLETPTYSYFEFLAQILAGLVLLFSFLHNLRENDGGSKDLYYWAARATICLALLTQGPEIINSLGHMGEHLAHPTQQLALAQERRFNAEYSKYVKGTWLDPNQHPGDTPLGLLTNSNFGKSANIEDNIDITRISPWNLFLALNVSRGVLVFANLFLLLLAAFTSIALRLASPLMIAVAIDRNLAQRITYPFVWGSIVLLLITPIVGALISDAAYAAAELAVIQPAPLPNDPGSQYMIFLAVAAMLIASLSMFAAPYIAYRLATGQVFEAVSSTISGWVSAMVASGIELLGFTKGTALERQAQVEQITGAAEGGKVRTTAAYEAQVLNIQASQTRGITSTKGSLQTNKLLTQAQATFNRGSLGTGVALQETNIDKQKELSTSNINVEADKQKKFQNADADYQKEQLRITRNVAVATKAPGVLKGVAGPVIGAVVGTAVAGPLGTAAGTGVGAEVGAEAGAAGAAEGGGAGMSLPLPALSGGGGSGGLVDSAVGVGATLYETHGMQAAVGQRWGQNTSAVDVARQGGKENVERYAEGVRAAQDTYQQAQEANINTLQGQSITAYQKGAGITIGGINKGAELDTRAARTLKEGQLNAIKIEKDANIRAAQLRQLGQIITGVTRDIARRVEQGMTAATRY